MTVPIQYDYVGVSPRGHHTIGSMTTRDLAEWVQKKFWSGWRELVVKRGGVAVGWIETDRNTGERVWCAEAVETTLGEAER